MDSNGDHYTLATKVPSSKREAELTLSEIELAVCNSSVSRPIFAAYEETANPCNTKQPKYRGKIRTWPGLCLLFIIVGGAIGLIVHYSSRAKDASIERIRAAMKAKADRLRIEDGIDTSIKDEGIYIDDDFVVDNPKVYPKQSCELPNYVSKGGKLFAVSKNGTEIAFQIKGVNWFGMETGEQIPFGLWENENNGTSVYAIAQFLSNNKFNSVRIPLSIQHILDNKPLEKVGLINRNANRAIDLTSYITLLQSIIKSLAYRQISVLISLHTLTSDTPGGLWYGSGISQENFLNAVDAITKNLCSDTYWNILGVDLKNEPFDATWGTGGATDFKKGAELIGARMLKGCSQWMAFVEGVNGGHTMTIDSKPMHYDDWYGGGLQQASEKPVELSVKNKVVYAPHYYTSAVYPAPYFYDDVVQGNGAVFAKYTEISDAKLQVRVDTSMYDMFGHILDKRDSAVLLGEFGGLYTKDAHPLLTNRRCTDFTIKNILKNSYSGGYMWSLNPESHYLYNPASIQGKFHEGLLLDDWRTANLVFLNALKPLDEMPDLKPTPCFKQEARL